MCPRDYYTNMRSCKDPKYLRYEMVRFAREYGIKPAARAFKANRKTVKKWLSRWEPGSLRGLENLSRAPKSPKCKIPSDQRKKAIKLKKKLKSFGAGRIKRDYGLSISEKAIRKIWKEEGLLKKKRRKHKTKQDLRELKAKWPLFSQIDLDTKELDDIPEYWLQMKRGNLPLYQYTAREVVSGLQFVAFAQECNLSNATLFAEILISHLLACGVKLSGCHIQTDNGAEFVGSWSAKEPSIFTKTIEKVWGFTHQTIPPAAHTFQADVETVHRIIEDEFYEVESFPSRKAFLSKATSYIIWFNTLRKNSGKKYQTPWQIIHQRDPTIKPEITLLPAINLDQIMKIKLANSTLRGYDLIPYPYNYGKW
jgi:transposase